MKKTFLLILITISINSLSQDFSPLLQLEGHWVMKAKKEGMTIHEVWTRADNHSLQAQGYRVFNGDTTLLESVKLVSENGFIFYRPTVPNQNEGKQVSFKLEKIQDNEYHFVNAQHDFPKRIVYKLIDADTLEVVIDDNEEITRKRSVYKFSRL